MTRPWWWFVVRHPRKTAVAVWLVREALESSPWCLEDQGVNWSAGILSSLIDGGPTTAGFWKWWTPPRG